MRICIKLNIKGINPTDMLYDYLIITARRGRKGRKDDPKAVYRPEHAFCNGYDVCCLLCGVRVFDATHHVSNQQEKVTICVNRMIYIYIYSVSKAGVRFLITFSFPEIGCRSNRPRCYYVRRDVPFRHQGVQDLT